MSVYKGTLSGRYPINLLASIEFLMMSCPPIFTFPDVGGVNPVITFIVVDFPAPFGPNNPIDSPLEISKLTSITAGYSP